MKHARPRVVAAIFAVMSMLGFSAPLRAQIYLTSGLYHSDPARTGSYVRWSNIYINQELGRIGYQYVPELTVGQQWEYDHGVDGRGYDLYRGFVVFDLPRFTGVVGREPLGIQDPDGLYPDVTQFLTRVTQVRLNLTGEPNAPDDGGAVPIDVRWSALSAAQFADGSIDPAFAYDRLIQGQLFDPQSPYDPAEPLTAYLNRSDGGPIVFSFTIPTVIDQHTYSVLRTYDPEISLDIEYDLYRAFSPVPEPATFALAGLGLCLAAAGIRARRLLAAMRHT